MNTQIDANITSIVISRNEQKSPIHDRYQQKLTQINLFASP
jgi:hypothetical protein